MAAGDPINGLITGGLGCELPAESMIITAFFNLGPIEITVAPPTPGIDGGSRPLPPGSAKDFYTPIDPVSNQPADITDYHTPYHVPVPKDIVTVKVKFGEKTYEKEYAIRENRLKILVNVLNLAKRGQDSISVYINNFKKIATNAVVKIMSFRKRN